MEAKTYKACLLCTIQKPLSEYYRSSNKNHTDGFNNYCKKCCKVNRALEAVRKRDAEVKLSVRQEYRAKIQLKIPYDPGITLVEIFRRHLGICHLCNTWVEPRRASMDHHKPLSKGGHHTWDNVKLTHLKCNLRKGNRDD